MIREECLAERVALSALKSGISFGPEIESQLWKNQFASGNQLLEFINK